MLPLITTHIVIRFNLTTMPGLRIAPRRIRKGAFIEIDKHFDAENISGRADIMSFRINHLDDINASNSEVYGKSFQDADLRIE